MSPITDSFSSGPGDSSGAIRLVQALRRHWLLIAMIAVIAVGSAAVLSYSTPKRYEASADILVSALAPDDEAFRGFTLIRATFGGADTTVTAARILGGPEIARAAMQSLGTVANEASVSVIPLGQVSIVAVVAKAHDPYQAAAVANRYAKYAVAARTKEFQSELATRIKRLKAQSEAIPVSERSGNFQYASLQQSIAALSGSVGTPDPTLRLLTEAEPPGSPVWPRPVFSIVAALFAALLLGGGIAALLEFASPRITREDDLLLGHRLPILARIPRLPTRVVHGYLSGRAQLPRGAWKGYRTLRAVLTTLGPDGGYPRTILLTSASPGDGKTTTAVNLAITLASSDLRVVLLDGDTHRPMVGNIFNVAMNRDGLTRVLSGRATVSSVLVPAPAHPHLKLLLTTSSSGSDLHASSDRLRHVLDELGAYADVIVIDAPPVPEVAEVLSMAAVADCVLVSVRLGHTRRDKLGELRDMLSQRGIEPAGFVVTTREKLQRESEYDYPGTLPVTPRRADQGGSGSEPVPAVVRPRIVSSGER